MRRHGFTGEILLAGDEPPYDRPPLSKQVLRGDWDSERATLMPPARFAAIQAEMHFDKRAVALDIQARKVSFADGSVLGYDELVVATGAQPRRLSETLADCIHELRTIDDADALRTAIKLHGEIVVIGGGFIGLEVAATAASLGARVTVIEPMQKPLAARIGAHAAKRLLDRHEAEGVKLRVGTGVRDITAADDLARIELADGSEVLTPVVCVGVGCVPGVGWLASSGLKLENGLVCDEYCAAAPNIWGAGDVANWYHAGLGRHIRIEHRTNAQEQAEAVARNILGARQIYTPVPFFWSDQFDIKLQCAGLLPEDPNDKGVVEEGDPEGSSFLRAFYRDEKLVGVIGWNSAKAMAAYRRRLSFDNPTDEITAKDEHLTMRNSV